MKNGISKRRLKRISTIRKLRAGRTEFVRFRDSSLLAVIYLFLTLTGSAACLLASKPDAFGLIQSSGWTLVLLIHASLLIASAVCARVILGFLAPEILKRNSRILMLCVVTLLTNLLQMGVRLAGLRLLPYLGADMANAAEFLPFLMPFLFAPALATLLAGPGAGIAIGVAIMLQNVLIVSPAVMLPVLLTGLLVAIISPILIKSVYRRGALMQVFFGAAFFQVFGIFLLLVLRKANFITTSAPVLMQFRMDMLLTLISVLAGYSAVLLFLPVLEHVFGACSKIRLHNFADLNAPLLMRLSLEAPGTNQHSQSVATLAATAAEQLGYNSLLCRVGGYYHDIGKLNSPASFTENIQLGAPNPHDQISPTMSALILSAHVKDGIGYALDSDLPVPVRQIISEHHGNSLMLFFYHKAQKLAEAKAQETGTEPVPVDENLYRYATAKPSTAESAIVSLADSVEAASRSLQHPTPSALEKLVSGIIDAKLQDGQLDQAPITCKDIAEIKRSFTATLVTMLHARIAYPAQEAAEKTSAPADSATVSPK